ncbi:MAG: BrnT family toxin [Candidatus Rokubacteria bacterium]|nr:BrnT family toxin [Candidatus Rokubacteria bacterium]
MRFEWDPPKAEANLRTHGVGFAEAVTVLEDDFALTREDPDAVDGQRFVTLGLSALGNLLVVVYTYPEPGIIRVISGWKASKRQEEMYEEGRS